jgi:hypothetical protein
VSTPFSAESRPANTAARVAAPRRGATSRSVKLGWTRIRSGYTPAAETCSARKRLGAMRRPTPSYAPNRRCSDTSTAAAVLAAREPSLHARRAACQGPPVTQAVQGRPWSRNWYVGQASL